MNLIGCEIINFEEIDSTNKYAKDNMETLTNGTVIFANAQLNGTGRFGRNWVSPKLDNIYMSIVIKEPINIADIGVITLITALSVSKAIKNITNINNIGIKWPNDIIINNKKVCGILCESKGFVKGISQVVVGIGINVNTTCFTKEIEHKATSLFLETGTKIKIDDLKKEIILQLNSYYTLFFKEPDFNQFLPEYKSLCLNISKKCQVINNTETLIGVCTNVAQNGNLEVKTENGIIFVNSNEVSIRTINGYI